MLASTAWRPSPLAFSLVMGTTFVVISVVVTLGGGLRERPGPACVCVGGV
jgi:hypothetical protein